jgi:hypothetical protein
MCYLTRSRDISSRDLVICCATSDVILLSGPTVSFCHAEEQILILIHTPQHIIGIPNRHFFDHPVMVWPLVQSKQPPVIVIRYVLMVKELGYNVSYYHSMNIVTWSCCNTNVGYVHHGIHLMVCMISLSIDINVTWSGNLNHQLTNELVFRGILGTLIRSTPHVYYCFWLTQL